MVIALLDPIFTVAGRLVLGAESPIVTGVIFAAAIPWIFLPVWLNPRTNLWLRSAATVLCVSALWCLILTQTRSALIGLILSLALGIKIASVCGLQAKTAVRAFICGAFLLIVLLWASDMRGRITPNVLLDDRSILNRFEIWSHVGDLIMIDPWRGLGPDEAGFIYSQWFSPGVLEYRYTNIFNSHLQIAVERGIPSFILYVFCLGSCLAWPTRAVQTKANRALLLAVAATASWCTILVSTLFSSLYYSGWVVAFSVANAAMVVITTWRAYGWSLRLRRGLVFSALSFASVGLAMAANETRVSATKIAKEFKNAFSCERVHAPVDGRTVALLVDPDIMGELYGKTSRNWLESSPSVRKLVTFDPRYPLEPRDWVGFSSVIVVGKAWRALATLPDTTYEEIIYIGSAPWEIAHLRSRAMKLRIYVPACAAHFSDETSAEYTIIPNMGENLSGYPMVL